jgi:hypothetical protein
MATLKISGDKMPPYEQRWVMRSARLVRPVAVVVRTERCA